MGTHINVGPLRFPKQGEWLGKRVNVCFHFKTEDLFPGTIVREDSEEPGRLIIALDDGRYVISTECMYSFNNVPTNEGNTPPFPGFEHVMGGA
jgi:hypothetical protein